MEQAEIKIHWPSGELDDESLDDPEDGAFAYCGRFIDTPRLTRDRKAVTCKVCKGGLAREVEL